MTVLGFELTRFYWMNRGSSVGALDILGDFGTASTTTLSLRCIEAGGCPSYPQFPGTSFIHVSCASIFHVLCTSVAKVIHHSIVPIRASVAKVMTSSSGTPSCFVYQVHLPSTFSSHSVTLLRPLELS